MTVRQVKGVKHKDWAFVLMISEQAVEDSFRKRFYLKGTPLYIQKDLSWEERRRLKEQREKEAAADHQYRSAPLPSIPGLATLLKHCTSATSSSPKRSTRASTLDPLKIPAAGSQHGTLSVPGFPGPIRPSSANARFRVGAQNIHLINRTVRQSFVNTVMKSDLSVCGVVESWLKDSSSI